ncbi:MAG TPA: DUF3617 domain-containing protein [Gallionellaceae bacterium]|nr:DUF3617 domain-containing protein [Gallionellaceae bacterium]
MKKGWLVVGMGAMAAFAGTVLAAPGEWWEITGKMEMPGMPFAMPAQTNKVCLPKGGEADPNRTQGKDSNCKMTDVQHSGNTVKFKGTCVNNGETMNMEGQTTHDGNSFKSNMKMTGKSHGEPVNMAMTSSGKRIGGACDTEELVRKAKAQADENMAKACDTSNYNTNSWVSSANLFIGPKPLCPGKKDELCKVMRNDVPHDTMAFQTWVQQEKIAGMPSAAKACNVNIESMRKSMCKARAHKGPLDFLDANCPTEAKAYRELQRKREECSGRGFTSGEKMKKCMGGATLDDEASDDEGSRKPKKAADDSGSTSDSVLQGAKKLKGLFGF